jgi:CubicO group peptidase (beta-lactamase class C family)
MGVSLLAGHSARAQERSPNTLTSRIAEWEKETLFDAGKVLWEGQFGLKDARTGEPVRRDTVFAACSNTKPVFAYAVVKLCEKGVMDLDTPLTKYTSRRFVEGDPRLDLITTRHVLTHTTGFPNWGEPGKPVPIQFTPGTQRQYSGEGFHYLQSVVQDVTRQPFAEFMRVNVLEPFGMASSRFVWDDEAYTRRVARGHDKDGTAIVEPPQTAAQKSEGLATYGAAAMLQTTPGDYAKFLLEIVDPKPADAFRLNERSWRDYLRPQFKRDEITSSGLGWVVGQFGALTFFTHAGSAPGWQCESYASVGRKAGIVILTNGDNFLPFREQLKLDLEFFTQLFAV